MSNRDGIKLIDQLPKDFDTKAQPVRFAPLSHLAQAAALFAAVCLLVAVLMRGYWEN